jgi:hypothetical protein
MYVEARTAQYDRGAAALTNCPHDVQMVAEEEDRVAHVLVVYVSDGQPDGVGPKKIEGGPELLLPFLHEHEVEHRHLMARPPEGAGDKGETQRKRRYEGGGPVFGNEKNFHVRPLTDG